MRKARAAGCSDLKRKAGVCERWGELEPGLELGCIQSGTGCEHMTLSSRERERGWGREGRVMSRVDEDLHLTVLGGPLSFIHRTSEFPDLGN